MGTATQELFNFDDTIQESYIHPRRYKCSLCSAGIVTKGRNFAKEKFVAHLEGDHDGEFLEENNN